MVAGYDDLDVTLMACSPLARGMLSGKIRSLEQLEPNDVRRRYPRFSVESFPKNVELVDRLTAIADDIGCTVSQLALAWLYHKNSRSIAIRGCDTSAYLNENLVALHLCLDERQMEEISSLFAPGNVHWDRYHTAAMKYLDRS